MFSFQELFLNLQVSQLGRREPPTHFFMTLNGSLKPCISKTLLAQSHLWKNKNNVWNLAKVKNKVNKLDGVFLFRIRHRRCSVRKGVLRNFGKSTGKYLCQSLVLNKFAGLRPATLLNKRLWHRCFPANFAKFLRTRFS